jgi:hypothetical protein
LVFHHMWETVNWFYDFLSSSPSPLVCCKLHRDIIQGGGGE